LIDLQDKKPLEPIRSEIFSAARLEMHAQSLARAQSITHDPRRAKSLSNRVIENRKVLEKSYFELLTAAEAKRAITPAAEWLIDNFHVVRAQLKDIHDHLPPSFYRELPKLAEGPLAGYPRVYGISWAFVAHTDSRFDPELLKSFLSSYQTIEPLTIGELWSVSTTIRIVLMENLRRLTDRIVNSQRARFDADQLSDELLKLSDRRVRPMASIIEDLNQKPFVGGFATQLLQRLRYQDSSLDPVLEWLEMRLSEERLTADQVVSTEHSSQTGANVTVRNIITSARMMSAFNWQDFFEDVSLVDETMRTYADYSNMDFATRDRYRHAIEELARHSPCSELEIARRVIANIAPASDPRESDPGFYLIGKGRFEFEEEIQFKVNLRLKIVRYYVAHATPIYLLASLLVSMLILAGPIFDAHARGVSSSLVAVLAFFTFFPASDIGLAIVNRLTVALLGPKHLPRFTFLEGIPEAARTFIVVPTLLTEQDKIESQLEQLEIHYLSNPDGDLYFALLTDWTDADESSLPRDQILIDTALAKLESLNAKYGVAASGFPRFYVLHRKRLFNPQEGKWIGWERKRGKLHEFNRLLLGDRSTSFIPLNERPVSVPSNVRFVITLDADTRLPIGAVKQLVGTLAHPLNQAKFDLKTQRVVEGYGILQPRITPALPSSKDSTIFQRLSAGPSGIDPYASAVSDVYQDLFGEGSYTGKGIYDVNVFEAALEGRIPENSLLSHDLFEANFARCGFLSDVEFFEDFPSHSEVAVSRSHRWTRGDWQLLPWIFGHRGRDIPLIGRWKMFDNLRRSLVNPATFVAIVLCLSAMRSNIWIWLAVSLLSLGIGAFVGFSVELFSLFGKNSMWSQLSSVLGDFYLGVGRAILFFILLPHHAISSLDAVVRALYRLLISHKKMLEWTTAAQVKASANLAVKSFVIGMRSGFIATAIAAVAVLASVVTSGRYEHLFFAVPILVLWLAAPVLARLSSMPPKVKLIRPVQPADIQYLHLTARRIWRFFATFVTAEERHLPPDNYQEDPTPVVAHRSSPTNFGLYLLSVLAAHDFGWIGVIELADRLSKTLKSMSELPRHKGHFFNWYETTGARPLEPKYISSVDNGNLAGHLLAVAQGCAEHLRRPIPTSGFNRGILDTLLLLERSIEIEKDIEKDIEKIDGVVVEKFQKLADELLIPGQLIEDRSAHWTKLRKLSDDLLRALPIAAASAPESFAWAHALQNDINSSAQDYLDLVSWSNFALLELSEPVLDSHGSVDAKWRAITARLALEVPLVEIPEVIKSLMTDILGLKKLIPESEKEEFSQDVATLVNSLETSLFNVEQLIFKLKETQSLCYKMFKEMDFSLLYDKDRQLFSIGYRVADAELDASSYDLLASEARLTSFIAIAKGDVPVAHWFKLGRGLTRVDNGVALVSWSGSMFEYLMPSLVMNNPPGSLIDQTCHLIIDKQIQYGSERAVPWGMSESAYNKRDLELTYQYSNFGIPDLALKRGLGADLVVAPYATILAAMYGEAQATENLRRLDALGAVGIYGFYEAVDFTERRLPEGQKFAVVKTYMAHHQGMSLIAIANIFKNGIMRERFHNEALVQAAELLMQERTPKNVGISKPSEESFQLSLINEQTEHVSRRYHYVNRLVPTTQILSNGSYSVMMTSSGAGFSRMQDLALTRWREDVTRDCWGSFLFIRDCASEELWSAGYQPTCVESESYEVTFAEDRVRIHREDSQIRSELEVFISPEDNAEIRRVTLTNLSDRVREIEVTSYAEIVLNTQLADQAHPAFSNLFVQTSYLPEMNALLATRRPRANDEEAPWLAHVVFADKHAMGEVQYETGRESFIGRGRSVRNPQAVDGRKLTNSIGSVLDPIFSLRIRVKLEPGVSSRITFSTISAKSRSEATELADKFRDQSTFERVSSLAWTQAQVELHFLNIEPDEAHLFQRLGTRLLFSDPSLRPSSDMIKHNKRDVTGLWRHSISGDNPIILVRIDDFEDRGIIRQLLKAIEYFGLKLLTVDLVILNDRANSYAQDLQTSLEAMVHSRTAGGDSRKPKSRGGVYILRADQLSLEDRALLYASARVTLSSRQGSLADQAKRMRTVSDIQSSGLYPLRPRRHPTRALKIPDLLFENGIGGFSKNGKEYVTVLQNENETPAPWINVIANSSFGFQVSESGSGYTWCENSRENQLTPWSNDPVSDPSGECFYILDRDSGFQWSPTAKPIRVPEATYISRHGQGYSSFSTEIDQIASELTQFAVWDQPLKISRIRLTNRSAETRRLTISAYVELVLGFTRSVMAPTTVTEFDSDSSILFATNPRSSEFGARVFFAGFKDGLDSYTGDRTEFIGRNGHANRPLGPLKRDGLSKRVGAALDPCAAMQTNLELAPGEEMELSFFMGQTATRDQAREIIAQARASGNADPFNRVIDEWDGILGKVQVETPDKSMDLMLNRWLLYQTLSCRFWARAAFYQAGGAFGFRDQLQDVMALVIAQPHLAREHILRAARRQYIEGDVQHWWHPPLGRGVRTHFSDDRIWLPFAVAHYLKVTGDESILREELPFIEGPLLRPDQEDSYYTPVTSHNAGSLYDHCVRALNVSLPVGAHGLPLIGAGDWNDGMNRIGHEGKGESVWMAWFLFANLTRFAEIADQLGDQTNARIWLEHAALLQKNAELHAWDGDWYLRAFFDDATPVGSSKSEECKIDSLTQTWAVISGAAESQRAISGIDAIDKYLVKAEDSMVLLFTPPFDKTPLDPGYIKGYLPGVRENGGQYTHAATWCVIANAMLGRGARAHELFSMLNPINHSATSKSRDVYRVEPYVIAADVYSLNPYAGRGGWTWYTGASGWMYRSAMEYILGMTLESGELVFNPTIPPEWKEFKITYRHGGATYHFAVLNPKGVSTGVVSIQEYRQAAIGTNRIRLVNDEAVHEVTVLMG
jgi:cyclic beta-1,2-glucan synthetase